jgi:hypothetical protein
MRIRPTELGLVLILTLASLAQVNDSSAKQSPPTRRDDTQEIMHGVTIKDPYRWLEDQNSADSKFCLEIHCQAAG